MELAEGKAIPLHLQPEGGETKSMSSEKLASFTNADMDINVICIYEVHGHLDGPDSECASLLVLRFNLGSRVTGRRFKAFRPLLTVHHSPRSNEADEPSISDCIEPGEAAVHISEFFSKKSKKSTFGTSLKVKPPDPIPSEGDISWSREEYEEWRETYRYTVQATRREERPGRRNKDDQIYWNAQQGRLIRSGIDIMQVAFVVFRKEGYNLELTFKLDSDVGFRYKVERGWRNFWGLPGSKSTVTLKVYDDDGPSGHGVTRKLKKTTVPEGVEPDYLRRLEKESYPAFRKLAWVHDTEPMQPARFYGAGKPRILLHFES
jgi:hypothetical protein